MKVKYLIFNFQFSIFNSLIVTPDILDCLGHVNRVIPDLLALEENVTIYNTRGIIIFLFLDCRQVFLLQDCPVIIDRLLYFVSFLCLHFLIFNREVCT